MEGMNIAKLEAVVEKLLAKMHDLRQENASLQAQLHNRNGKIAELEDTILNLSSNQEEVSARVTNLLSSIEEFERSIAGEDQESGVEEESRESRGGDLFSMAE